MIKPHEWDVQVTPGLIILNGGYLETDKDVFEKTEQILGHPINHGWFVMHRRSAIASDNGKRYYYVIYRLDNGKAAKVIESLRMNAYPERNASSSHAINDAKRKEYENSKPGEHELGDAFNNIINAPEYYSYKFDTTGLKSRDIGRLLIVAGTQLSRLLSVICMVAGAITKNALLLSLVIPLGLIGLLGFKLPKYINHILIVPEMHKTSIRNGFIYIIKPCTHADKAKNDKILNKIKRRISKIASKNYSNARIEIRNKFGKHFIIVTSDEIRNDVPYDVDEFIASCKNDYDESKLISDTGLLKQTINNEDIKNSHEALKAEREEYITSILDLSNQIREMEASELDSNAISESINQKIRTFLSASYNANYSDYEEMINQLNEVKNKIVELKTSRDTVNCALYDVNEIVKIRSRS